MPYLMTSSVAHTAAGFEKIYVVHRTSGFPADGFHAALPEERTTDSAYLSEDQAYATAIRRQIAYMERQTGESIVELRTDYTTESSEEETDEDGDPEDEGATAENGNRDATGKKRRRD